MELSGPLVVPIFGLVNLDYPFSERIVSVLKDGIFVQLCPLQLYSIYNTLYDFKFVHFRVVNNT